MTRSWALAMMCWGSCATSAASAAASSWDDLVAAAQREGRLVVAGPAHPEVRQALPAAFKARFGINLEYIGGPASAAVAKLHAERLAGIYSLDVTLAGIQTVATILYREGLLEPIKPLLLLPEVLDGSKWKKGSLWFMDPERQYVLRLLSSELEQFSINTLQVKPDGLRAARDLLDAKWKGRIATHDPTVPGTGSNHAAQLYVQLLKNAPHPNAARLFINWLASKEGLEVYARAVQWSPTRNDIDERSFVPADSIPTPGVDYFDSSDWEFTVTTKEKARLRVKELVGR